MKQAKEVVHACEDDSILKFTEKLVHPFQDMGIQIIAEGIETERQFHRMLRFGDGFQGYWISEPRLHFCKVAHINRSNRSFGLFFCTSLREAGGRRP
ncbi:hypothetical protein [Paenibacillus thiaminolyticus]|uniref:hypothetical protein n=1 Tax=Paenibacillus thiaminolyticus TaxID=49283 RepID=UPI003B984AEF